MAVDGTYRNGDVTVKIEGWETVARDLKNQVLICKTWQT